MVEIPVSQDDLREALIAARTAMHQASDTGDDDALVREAFQEALKRYPDAHGALTFFWTAAGFAAVPPTSEQMTWAKGCADRLQAKAHEGGPNG
jgi:hypothetical protein